MLNLKENLYYIKLVEIKELGAENINCNLATEFIANFRNILNENPDSFLNIEFLRGINLIGKVIPYSKMKTISPFYQMKCYSAFDTCLYQLEKSLK